MWVVSPLALARRPSRSRRSCGASCPSSRRSPPGGARVSIDTRKAVVARAAVAAGATLINDVGAALGELAAELGVGLGGHAQPGRARARCRTIRATTTSSPRSSPFLVERAEAAVGPRVSEVLDRSWHRLRQDGRAQPGAAPPPRRAGRDRVPRRRRHEPEGVPRRPASVRSDGRPGAGADRRSPRGLARHRHLGHDVQGAAMIRAHDVRATLTPRWSSAATSPRTQHEGAPHVPMKGKWAQGIQPRNFAWIIKDQLAVCERPGGYGANHRRVRRQEEIIWIREQGFACVDHADPVAPQPAQLRRARRDVAAPPVRPTMTPSPCFLEPSSPSWRRMLAAGGKVLLHHDELGDRVAGLVAGYLLWDGRRCRSAPRRSRSSSSSLSPPARPPGARPRAPVAAAVAESCLAAADRIELRGLRVPRASSACLARGAGAQPQPLEVDLDLEADLAAAGRDRRPGRHGRLRRPLRRRRAGGHHHQLRPARARSSSGSPTGAAAAMLADRPCRDGHGAQAAAAGRAAARHGGRPPHPGPLMRVRAFLGLGSNLGDRRGLPADAVASLSGRRRRVARLRDRPGRRPGGPGSVPQHRRRDRTPTRTPRQLLGCAIGLEPRAGRARGAVGSPHARRRHAAGSKASTSTNPTCRYRIPGCRSAASCSPPSPTWRPSSCPPSPARHR